MASSIARDALHVVLGFLSLEETVQAGCTSRCWHAASRTEPPKDKCRLVVRDLRFLPTVGKSHMRRHISVLAPEYQGNGHECLKLQSWAEAGLIRSHLPKLRILQVAVPFEADHPVEFPLPSTLLSCKLYLVAPSLTFAAGNVLIQSLLQAPRLTSCDLAFHLWANDNDLDLSPLRGLTELAHLQIGFGLNERHVAAVRSLSPLLTLRTSSAWGSEELTLLCADGHQLHNLRMIDLAYSQLDSRAVRLLSTLSGLTALHSEGLRVHATAGVLASLHLLPRLRTISLDLEEATFVVPEDASPLVPHPSLREMTISNLHASDWAMTALLASLPKLRVLSLRGVTMESLAPLASSLHLRTLSLELTSGSCQHPAHYHCSPHQCLLRDDLEEQITVLERLPKLTSLTLQRLGITRIDASVLDQLRVPSARMPRLRHFACIGQVDAQVTAQKVQAEMARQREVKRANKQAKVEQFQASLKQAPQKAKAK